jgi:hypothetical protein
MTEASLQPKKMPSPAELLIRLLARRIRDEPSVKIEARVLSVASVRPPLSMEHPTTLEAAHR